MRRHCNTNTPTSPIEFAASLPALSSRGTEAALVDDDVLAASLAARSRAQRAFAASERRLICHFIVSKITLLLN